jgi:hypothetical protein
VTKVIHLDELLAFHVKDTAKLKPGTKVLFGHVPPMIEHPSMADRRVFVSHELAVVTEVRDVSPNQLNPANAYPSGEKVSTRIFYRAVKGLRGKIKNTFAADRGVLPYHGAFYNDTNFTVILSEVEAAGFDLELSVTAGYQARLDEFNEKVVVRDYDGDYGILNVSPYAF